MPDILTNPSMFVGVDVQVKRGCSFYAITAAGDHVDSGWLPSHTAPEDLRHLLCRLTSDAPSRIAVGIDAPRCPLDERRQWSWSGKRGAWSSAPNAVGAGRHCEVVISAQRLANPQWTPLRHSAPEWMQLGFALFERLADLPHVYEVFPSAAYTQLANDATAMLPICFAGFLPGPKDMLDAAIGALVVRDYLDGKGCAVGGGDGLGSIILPRPLRSSHAKLADWPSAVMPTSPHSPTR
ncbi:MAG: hypothetical protein H7247_07960 [Polaromonas sp.]|nr:hypothetical protein [Gemmatimonadaceae bacterium]